MSRMAEGIGRKVLMINRNRPGSSPCRLPMSLRVSVLLMPIVLCVLLPHDAVADSVDCSPELVYN